MSEIVNIHDAQTHLSRLVARASAGEEIVLARAGVPVARLVPMDPRPDRVPGLRPGAVGDAFFDPLPDDELDAWGQ